MKLNKELIKLLSEGKIQLLYDKIQLELLKQILDETFKNCSYTVRGTCLYYIKYHPGWSGQNYPFDNIEIVPINDFIMKEESKDKRFPFRLNSLNAKMLLDSIDLNCDWRNKLVKLWAKDLFMFGYVIVDEELYIQARKEASEKQNSILDSIVGKDSPFKIGDWVITINEINTNETDSVYHKYKKGEVFQIYSISNKTVFYTQTNAVDIDRIRLASAEEYIPIKYEKEFSDTENIYYVLSNDDAYLIKGGNFTKQTIGFSFSLCYKFENFITKDDVKELRLANSEELDKWYKEYPKVPKNLPKKGQPVFVKNSNEWECRVFSEYKNKKFFCYRNRRLKGVATSWPIYSITNPITEGITLIE